MMSPGVMYFARVFYCQVTLLFKSLKFPIQHVRWWWSLVNHIIMLGRCPYENIIITWLCLFSEPADMLPLTFTAKVGTFFTFTAKVGTFFSKSRGSKCHHKSRGNNSPANNLHLHSQPRTTILNYSVTHSRFNFMTVSCLSFLSFRKKHHQLFQKERRQKSRN